MKGKTIKPRDKSVSSVEKDSHLNPALNVEKAQVTTPQRRSVLKKGSTLGVAALMAPTQWSKPVIDSVVMPVHAQMSPEETTTQDVAENVETTVPPADPTTEPSADPTTVPPTTVAPTTEPCAAEPGSMEFGPGEHTFIVPACVTSINITALGAKGGGVDGVRNGQGGEGGTHVVSAWPVSPGDSLSVAVAIGGGAGGLVGGDGMDGVNGGGGGGSLRRSNDGGNGGTGGGSATAGASSTYLGASTSDSRGGTAGGGGGAGAGTNTDRGTDGGGGGGEGAPGSTNGGGTGEGSVTISW